MAFHVGNLVGFWNPDVESWRSLAQHSTVHSPKRVTADMFHWDLWGRLLCHGAELAVGRLITGMAALSRSLTSSLFDFGRVENVRDRDDLQRSRRLESDNRQPRVCISKLIEWRPKR